MNTFSIIRRPKTPDELKDAFHKGKTNFSLEELQTFVDAEDDGEMWAMAVYMASCGFVFEEDKWPLAVFQIQTSEIVNCSLAHYCAADGYIFTRKDILEICEPMGRSVASVMVVKSRDKVPRTHEFLRIQDTKTGLTAAHYLVMNGENIDEADEATLSLQDRSKNTPAHTMAIHGYLFNSPTILSLTNIMGWSVAETAVLSGKTYPPDHPVFSISDEFTARIKKLTAEIAEGKNIRHLEHHKNKHLLEALNAGKKDFTVAELNTPIMAVPLSTTHMPLALMLVDSRSDIPDDSPAWAVRITNGNTVAHFKAWEGVVFDEHFPYIGLTDSAKLTVAHICADVSKVAYPEDSPILYYADKRGITVAHVMAANGYVFPPDHPCLGVVTVRGDSVQDVQDGYAMEMAKEKALVEQPT